VANQVIHSYVFTPSFGPTRGGFMLGEISGEFGIEEPTGWVEHLGVDPGFRRKAVGRQMLNAMLEHFRRRGACSVQTLVDDDMGEILSVP
jgi:ribosomal protein S18 acetylase RimI-like enzyme